MRPDLVVVVSPKGQLAPCIVQAVEHLLVQEFVAQAAVEAFDEGVLLGLARVDIMPVDIVVVRPFQDRPTGELCAPSRQICGANRRISPVWTQDH